MLAVCNRQTRLGSQGRLWGARFRSGPGTGERGLGMSGELLFWLSGFLFLLAELAWPARPIDRRRHLGWDLLGYLSGSLCDAAIVLAVGAVTANRTSPAFLGGLPLWLGAVVAVIVLDFMVYWLHRLRHTRRLWRLHRFHHSIEELWWLAGNRISPLDNAVAIVPLVLFLWAAFPPETGLFISTFVVLPIATLANHWQHVNLAWNTRRIERIFITPRLHRVHHAAVHELEDKNFGALFSIWDQLFGTYHPVADQPAEFPIGIPATWRERARMALGL